MIEYCESLQRAIEIKTILDGILAERSINIKQKTFSIWIESFDNCREQGLVIKLHHIKKAPKNIAIVVHRNSDETRIFEYEKTKFPTNLIGGAVISDITFSYNKLYETAEYIFEMIKSYIGDDL